MPHQTNVSTDCRLVASFVDEGELPEKVEMHTGEPVRTRLLAEFIEDEPELAFTVLLKDGRTAIVRGHQLHHEPASETGLEVFSIFQRTHESDRVVAVFNSADVAGIFHGDLRESRLSA